MKKYMFALPVVIAGLLVGCEQQGNRGGAGPSTGQEQGGQTAPSTSGGQTNESMGQPGMTNGGQRGTMGGAPGGSQSSTNSNHGSNP